MKQPRPGGGDGMSYTRRDEATARVIYKAQVVLRVLGAAAARTFMRGMQLDPALIERVLRAPQGKLRR